MKKRKFLNILLVSLLIAALLAGCGSKASDSIGNYREEFAPETMAQNYDYNGVYDDVLTDSSVSTGSTENPQSYQKKIRKMELDVETEALDELLANVESRVNELGGYVEQKEVYRGSVYADRVYRHASLTLRVPAEKADSFVAKVGEVSNITSTVEDVEDVTLQYVATESRITALTTEETRLLELLAQAENMEDLLLIESRLTDVRTELEEYTSQLRLFDNLVNYATISLYVSEVKEYTPVEEKTFWQRIGSGFVENLKDLGNGLENFIVFLITGMPYFILIAVIVTAIVLVVKTAIKRKKQKKATENPQ